MHTVHPAIVIGSYGWDEERLPRDEFMARRAELDALMDARGWTAMLIHADAREHGALAYYTNFIPRLRWAMALLPRHGEPRLLVSMSARDMPAMKLMTWIADVRTGWDWAGGFDSWLAALQPEGQAAVGTLGFAFIAVDLHRAVERSVGNRIRLDDAAPFLPRERPLRPREMSLARDRGALAAAAAAMAASWRDGQGNEAAVLAAERAARAAAAQDVRTLVSFDGGRTLAPFAAPFAGRFAARTEPFLAYVAVKSAGFWAETFVTLSSPLLPRAEAALEAALAAVAPGAAAARVYAAAMAAFAPLPLHPVLSGRVGRRIGFSLDEGGAIEAAATGTIAPGSLYALHVGTEGAIASALVAVGTGVEILWRSRQSG